MKRLLLFLILAGMTACTYHYDRPQRGVREKSIASYQVRQYPNTIGQIPGAVPERQGGYSLARTHFDSTAVLFIGQLAEMNEGLLDANARLEDRLSAMETDMRRLQWMLGAMIMLLAGLVVGAIMLIPRRNANARSRPFYQTLNGD